MASMLEQMVIDRTIDHYRIVRRIGQGGMGTVYLATHEKTGRRAAIKFLHASAGPESWARFFNEARAAAHIAHPGVITIYHDGVLEPERLPYIIMEYLEGDSLAAHFAAAGRGYRPEWLRYVRQIASAMAAVHTQGIVHRDLKPDKITPVEKWLSFFRRPSEKVAEVLVTHWLWSKHPKRRGKQDHQTWISG